MKKMETAQNARTYWFVFCQDQLLLHKDGDGGLQVPLQQQPPVAVNEWTHIHELALFDGVTFKAFALEQPVAEDDRQLMMGLRRSFDCLPHDLYLMAGKAHEIIFWDRNNRFCPVCGTPMNFHTSISKLCPNCGKEIWPVVSTAIIVLIRRGEEILLVHARNFRGDYYGLVAGFVETGETLEECVQREVFEETGLRVSNIRYFGSQPWPYPLGLMVGFTADYLSGDIRLQTSELSAGKFFSRNNLPEIPGKMSMARMLIDDWLEKSKG